MWREREEAAALTARREVYYRFSGSFEGVLREVMSSKGAHGGSGLVTGTFGYEMLPERCYKRTRNIF